jgi:hypothetical protein
MALFGTDMTEVTTPDGRRITLPSQLAAQFPGLTPVRATPTAAAEPAFEPPAAPPAPVFTPQDQTDLAAAPVVQAPRPQPQLEPPPAPQRPQVTDAGLRRMGNAGVYNAQSAAVDEQQAAVRQQAQVDADEATKVGERLVARDEETNRILQERAKAAADHQAYMDGKFAEYEKNAKAIASTKIDRSLEHPILAAIGVAMGVLGSAMARRGDKNPALDMVMQQIDRKVAGQMQDLEKRRGDLALQRDSIGMADKQGRDKLAEIDTRRLAAIDQAKAQIETIRAQSSSPRAIAAGAQLLADLDSKRGQLLGATMDREQTKKHQEDLLKEQRAGRAQAASQFERTFAENKRQFDVREANDLKQAALAAAAKGKAASDPSKVQKENEERGISDPTTGERLIQPEGIKLKTEAEKLDSNATKLRAAAEAEKDPNKQQALAARADAEEQRASLLRAEVAEKHTWRVGNSDNAFKISKLIGTTQSIASTADEVKGLRAKYGPELLSGDAKAQMQEKETQLLMFVKNAWELGVLTGKDAEYIQKSTGGDPSALTAADFSRLFGQVDKSARLDSLVRGVEENTRNQLRAQGYKGDYNVKRDAVLNRSEAEQAAVDALQKPTPLEEAASQARPGILDPLRPSNTGAAIWGEPESAGRRRELEAESKSSTRYPGLSDDQASAVEAQLATYQKYNKATDDKSFGKAKFAAETLVGLAVDQKRPKLSAAALGALKERAPELYQQAIGQLPHEARQQREGNEQAVMGIQPIDVLRDTAVAGDPAAKQELARRAVAGDKDAVRAIQDVINSRGVR